MGGKNGGFWEAPSREIFEVLGNFEKFLINMYAFGKSEKVKLVNDYGISKGKNRLASGCFAPRTTYIDTDF